jgi:8-oxo-dGTP pyrophosphatase MutT (NUDIX family)
MEERTVETSRPWTGRRIGVRVDEVERSDGHRTTREIVEHPGAVGILAWDGELLAMVTQWRHATGQALLEIPAGTLEPDEPALDTAKRELAEEVGLAAATWVEGPRRPGSALSSGTSSWPPT